MISEWQTSWMTRPLFPITHHCSTIIPKISPCYKNYTLKSASERVSEWTSGVNLIFII